MRRVLITAAASGIGRSIAEAFVEAGDRVHVADTDEDELASLAKLRGVGTTVAASMITIFFLIAGRAR